jgi:GAF domain-containing protein/anti-sigma regulatory factor (Ser/Thr protein kinase)
LPQSSSVTPQTAPPRLHFDVLPEPAHLLRARERLRDYLRQYCAAPRVIDDVVLCVEEACTNAIRHSGSPAPIAVSLKFDADHLVAVVKDHGHGFDLEGFDSQATPDPLLDHGRGLFIITALMDSLELRRDAGLEVRMTTRAVARCEPSLPGVGLGEQGGTDSTPFGDARTRAMLDEIDEGFVALDWEYRYLHVNAAALREARLSREEMLGRCIWDLVPALATGPEGEALRAAMVLGRPSIAEYLELRGWVEARVYPTSTGVSLFWRDISERKHKEEAHDRLLARTTLLNRIAAAAAGTLDFKELADQALAATEDLLGATTGNVFLVDEAAGMLRSLANFGIHDEAFQLYHDVPLDDGTISGRVALSGVVATHDAPETPDAGARVRQVTDARVRQVTGAAQSSWIILPMRAGGVVVGTLGFSFVSARPFEPNEVALYQSVADQLGVGLEKARLYDAATEAQRQSRQELQTTAQLLEAAEALAEWTDLSEIVRRLARTLLHATPHSRVIVDLWDEARGEIEVAASEGPMPLPLGSRWPIAAVSSAARRSISEQATQLGDYDALPAAQRGRVAQPHQSHLALHVPLVRRQKTVGLLVVDDPGERREFNEREIRLVEGIAAQAAVAVENARLFEAEVAAQREARRELETSALLLETAATATSWTDLDHMLGQLGDLLVRSTDHSRVLLELWDEEREELEVAVSRGATVVPRQRFGLDEVSEAAREVVATKATRVIDYAQTALPGEMKRYVDEHAFLLVLSVPIVYRERLVGLIMVDQPGEARPFSVQEIAVVEAIAAQAGAAVEHGRLLERESRAARLEQPETWDRATRLLRRLQAHRLLVLVVAIALQSAILAALDTVNDTRHLLGLPGSVVALMAVVAGALAGPLTGGLVAIAGGGVFYVTVGREGANASLLTTLISAAIWLTAGVLSGLLAKGLNDQGERRRATAVALARADAAHETQLAEQARTEKLAAELQRQTEDLRVVGEELKAQSDEVHSQNRELSAQRDQLAARAERLSLLKELAELGASTLGQAETAQRQAEMLMRALQSCTAFLFGVDESRRHLVALALAGVSEQYLAKHAGPIDLAGPGESARVYRAGRPSFVRDVATDPSLSDYGRAFTLSLGQRSGASLPLIVRGAVTGCLALAWAEPHAFDADEVSFLESVAFEIALGLENARLYEEQQGIATILQENFIHKLPDVAGLELGVVSRTANAPELVGGDFSDVFVVDDTHVVALIGDVAGKGVRAAGMTETVRSTVRALAAVDPSPAFVLARTNELLMRFDPDEPHVTAFLAVLDPHTGHLSYASAGHPAPVHLRAFVCRPLDVTFGPPLGSFARPYTNAHTMLTFDDYLVLYTDGVTEARRGSDLLGERRLVEIVGGLRGRSAQEAADAVCNGALEFAGMLRDDLQVVVLRLA